MRVAIHQPNFFPWYPYFEKILRADIFVILQNCQFEKNNFQKNGIKKTGIDINKLEVNLLAGSLKEDYK